MPTQLIDGQTTWKLSQDKEGYREYRVSFKVIASPSDGPSNVLHTQGLPDFGSWWIIDADADIWAWCTHEATVEPEISNEPNTIWTVERVFSTKPPDESDRPCKENQVEDPLLEIPQISGSFVRYSVEATQDYQGRAILNSAWEQLRGPQLEFDGNRPQVKIEMNIPVLDLALLASMVDTLNAYALWGLPPRCIKLSEAGWERKFYGACYVYFRLGLTFDIDFNTFDRYILDEGSKVLMGHWDYGQSGAWITDPVAAITPPPAPTLVQGAFGITSVGPGWHYYALTTVTLAGETMLGDYASTNIAVGATINISWEPQEGATGYKIYRSDGGDFQLLTTISSGTTGKYQDDGHLVPSGAPPTRSTAGVIAPNYLNPSHFIKAKDRQGENMHVILNGFGMPANVGRYLGVGSSPTLGTETTTEGRILVQYYGESDFTILGIPLDLTTF